MTGSRKVALCVLITAVASLLVWAGKIDGDQYVSLMTTNIAGFIVGNGAEHWAKRG